MRAANTQTSDQRQPREHLFDDLTAILWALWDSLANGRKRKGFHFNQISEEESQKVCFQKGHVLTVDERNDQKGKPFKNPF